MRKSHQNPRLRAWHAAVPLAMLVAGCATPDRELGIVVQHNVVAQVVDLEPQYAGVPIEGGSGERAVDGVKRYNKGAVKELLTSTTALKK